MAAAISARLARRTYWRQRRPFCQKYRRQYGPCRSPRAQRHACLPQRTYSACKLPVSVLGDGLATFIPATVRVCRVDTPSAIDTLPNTMQDDPRRSCAQRAAIAPVRRQVLPATPAGCRPGGNILPGAKKWQRTPFRHLWPHRRNTPCQCGRVETISEILCGTLYRRARLPLPAVGCALPVKSVNRVKEITLSAEGVTRFTPEHFTLPESRRSRLTALTDLTGLFRRRLDIQ